MAARKPRVINKAIVDETEQQEDPKPQNETGLYVSVKGPIKEEEADYMHPQDLARYELFRTKKELAQARKVIVEKEEGTIRLMLKWQEQAVRIAKLEHDAKMRDISELKKELDKTFKAADESLKSISKEIQDKYNLTPETLIYDDESGKLMPMDVKKESSSKSK